MARAHFIARSSSRPFGSSFTLADVPNKVALLEPESLTSYSDGAGISQWDDTSGATNHFTQATGADQPVCKTNILNGYRVARFVDSTDNMQTTLAISSGSLSLAIVYATASSGTHRAIQGTSNNWLVGPYSSKHELYAGAFASPAGPAVTLNSFRRHIVTQDATTATNYVNNVQYGTVSSPSTYPGTFRLSRNTNFGDWLDGDIAFLVISNSIWSGSVITNLDALLATKFGL